LGQPSSKDPWESRNILWENPGGKPPSGEVGVLTPWCSGEKFANPLGERKTFFVYTGFLGRTPFKELHQVSLGTRRRINTGGPQPGALEKRGVFVTSPPFVKQPKSCVREKNRGA